MAGVSTAVRVSVLAILALLAGPCCMAARQPVLLQHRRSLQQPDSGRGNDRDRDRDRDRDDRGRGRGEWIGGGYNNYGGGPGGGFGGGGGPDGFNNLFNPLSNRLGIGSSGAQCLSFATANSISPLGGSSLSSANSFSISGGGLGGIASCGASAQAASQTLQCRRYAAPYGGNLCDFAGQFGTNCNGLQVVNPGVGFVNPGQSFNVPPCNFNG